MNCGVLRLRVAVLAVVLSLGAVVVPTQAFAVPASVADGAGGPSGDGDATGSEAPASAGPGGEADRGEAFGGGARSEAGNPHPSDSRGSNQPMKRARSNLLAKINAWLVAREMQSGRAEAVHALLIAPVFIVEPRVLAMAVPNCAQDCTVVSLY